jgi:DNA gyrase subunit A
VRVVIELKRDATPDVVLNQLFRFTPLQTSFGCNMLALNGGRPEQLDLKRVPDRVRPPSARRWSPAAPPSSCAAPANARTCSAASPSRSPTSTRWWRRSAPRPTPAEARERLMTRAWPAADIAPYIALIDDPSHRVREDGTYLLSETQARAILELRLQRLTALGVKEITDELEDAGRARSPTTSTSCARARIMGIISDELREVRELFAVPRARRSSNGTPTSTTRT